VGSAEGVGCRGSVLGRDGLRSILILRLGRIPMMVELDVKA
jgi:hypothetical protein